MILLTNKTFSVLDKLADSDRPYAASADELIILGGELKKHGDYQILMWRRDGDVGDQIEIFVTYGEERK